MRYQSGDLQVPEPTQDHCNVSTDEDNISKRL